MVHSWGFPDTIGVKSVLVSCNLFDMIVLSWKLPLELGSCIEHALGARTVRNDLPEKFLKEI